MAFILKSLIHISIFKTKVMFKTHRYILKMFRSNTNFQKINIIAFLASTTALPRKRTDIQ